MFIKNNVEYESFFKGGVEYSSFFKNGVEYGGEEAGFGYYPTLNEAILLAMSNGYTIPPENELEALSDYLYLLDSRDIFQKFDTFYMMLGSGDGDFKTINLADPSKFKGVLNGTLNINNLGIRSDGASGMGYVDTGMKILTNTTKMSGDSMSRGALITQRSISTSAADSIIEGTYEPVSSAVKNRLYLSNLAATRVSSINNLNSTPSHLNNTSNLYFYMARRSGVNFVDIRYGGLNHSTTTNGVAVPDEQNTLLLRNVVGNMWGLRIRLGVYFAGSALSNDDFLNLRTDTQDFANNIGIIVTV